MALGKFYGIGVGPGESELLTLKGKRILNEVDIVFAPQARLTTYSMAAAIVKPHLQHPEKLTLLEYPMTRETPILKAFWNKAASQIVEPLKQGKNVAYLTLGDPFIFSTYYYTLRLLKQLLPDLEAITTPGISSFSAMASFLNMCLVEGSQKLAVVPVEEEVEPLRPILQEFDCIVMLKVGKKLGRVIRLLKELEFLKQGIMISYIGTPKEKVTLDLTQVRDEESGYMTTIIIKKPSEGGGDLSET